MEMGGWRWVDGDGCQQQTPPGLIIPGLVSSTTLLHRVWSNLTAQRARTIFFLLRKRDAMFSVENALVQTWPVLRVRIETACRGAARERCPERRPG